MKGHIAKKGNRYYIVINMGKDEVSKKRILKWMPGGYDRKKDAEKVLPDILSSINHGTFVEPTDDTFGSLMATWLQEKKSEVRPGTWKSYAWLVNMHLIPHLGHIKLMKLEPKHLRDLYHEILFKKKGIAAASIRKLHVLVMDALNRAVEWRKIPYNMAAVVKLPQGKAEKFEVWDEEQLKLFLDEAIKDQYFIIFELAASTGMRQSEILGLRWKDVDLQAGRISVRQAYTKGESGHEMSDTKTEKSVRSIALFPETVEFLKQHKANQNEHHMRNRKLYQDHGLVAQSGFGTPVNPRNLMRNYYKILKIIHEHHAVPKVRFHDLRHTHATILLKRGVHPKIVQERLGHSSINVTLDTYSHVLPNLQEAVLKNIGDSILGERLLTKLLTP
ncbi:site-specific integrase [Paenibacillus koleovorans]|uniref:site-specific integrase n=1 Tax=Paenibacillus koleovorans TaxID=121608 RepID=UPI000FD7BB3C|nr:site-specific integrase [Paenibacillus koleovorans]